ncbi:2OG-Fe(II) oxygenase [Peribacillus butanolivorans]|uniref:2OG-Fe(II) oxygenase n=1 Tax=Peribacillus butanolivorans TaxID=421767 RepID=UPI003D2858AA
MVQTSSISNKWEKWIVENLKNGIQPSKIVEVMLQKGCNLEETYSTVLGCLEKRDPYHYDEPRINISGNFVKTSTDNYKIVGMFNKPLIVLVENFFSGEECDKLIDLSGEKLKPSLIFDSSTGRPKPDPQRTSKGSGISTNEHELVTVLEKRISEFMNCPSNHGERLQVMNYKKGDEFKPHFDYLPESQINPETGGQRISTLIVYLNDVEKGGATSFPNINFSVAPKKGSALYFEYCNEAGQINPLTLHCSDPVGIGEKWIAAKMMREKVIEKPIK